MPQNRLSKQVLREKANGKKTVERSITGWTNYIEKLGWNRLKLNQIEMMEVMEDREM